MLVVQLVLGDIYVYIYMIIVGKSMPVDNYEQCKRVINHWETIYILETKKLFDLKKKKILGVCEVIYNNLLLIHL